MVAALGKTDQTVFEGLEIWVLCVGVLELGFWDGKVAEFGCFGCWEVLGCGWND